MQESLSERGANATRVEVQCRPLRIPHPIRGITEESGDRLDIQQLLGLDVTLPLRCWTSRRHESNPPEVVSDALDDDGKAEALFVTTWVGDVRIPATLIDSGSLVELIAERVVTRNPQWKIHRVQPNLWSWAARDSALAINTKLARIHGFTPAMLLLGYTPRHRNIFSPSPSDVEIPDVKYTAEDANLRFERHDENYNRVLDITTFHQDQERSGATPRLDSRNTNLEPK
ncbi:hypothetical protein EMCG_06961 [[Emmonsia] crescens]|uniref:Uncharacterized protein n=1 Tax=[Emmonsia] crescens TaxID=73230 RepID=A0A0G2I9N2_9EURO|nr:hypothetical protein EMCG_06961 [Emmonsia crescens UAMH 3008]